MPMSEFDLNVVYDNTLDGGRYRLRVIHQDNGGGYLTVTQEAEEKLLYACEVPLAYGAIFGPDASDVAEWQEIAIKIVDNQ